MGNAGDTDSYSERTKYTNASRYQNKARTHLGRNTYREWSTQLNAVQIRPERAIQVYSVEAELYMERKKKKRQTMYDIEGQLWRKVSRGRKERMDGIAQKGTMHRLPSFQQRKD